MNLTQLMESVINGLHVAAVVSDASTAAGVQKAADIWGLQVDLFVVPDARARADLTTQLLRNQPVALITDAVASDSGVESAVKELRDRQGNHQPPFPVVTLSASPVASEVASTQSSAYDRGFEALKLVRGRILPMLPKYDEVANYGFPISPVPDSFLQATKFPYPEPLVRSVRTVSSISASAHAHTSCHAIALLGNMLHRTSARDANNLLLGFEGGNLSVHATAGAIAPDKLSAVMTSYVLAFRGSTTERRDLLSENDGKATSRFAPAVHAPEELDAALTKWRIASRIANFRREGTDELVIEGYRGRQSRFRASFFIISTAKKVSEAEIEEGIDGYGRRTLEVTSSQRFTQLFVEVPARPSTTPPGDPLQGVERANPKEGADFKKSGVRRIGVPLIPTPRIPVGGVINQAGGRVAGVTGFPLGEMLSRTDDTASRAPSYVLALEGGFLVVTPEAPLTAEKLKHPVARIDFDERGPLGSDQTLTVSFVDGERIVLRRTVLNFGQLDAALEVVRQQALISGWDYVGARGQGLSANVVLYNFFGKNRKFMSSLNTWPSEDVTTTAYVRWYVDGMQRLNFSLVTKEGWRQEFVEVPLEVPPIPRDVVLFSGVSTLD